MKPQGGQGARDAVLLVVGCPDCQTSLRWLVPDHVLDLGDTALCLPQVQSETRARHHRLQVLPERRRRVGELADGAEGHSGAQCRPQRVDHNLCLTVDPGVKL